MFDNFTKDKQIVDKYIDNYHLHKNNNNSQILYPYK